MFVAMRLTPRLILAGRVAIGLGAWLAPDRTVALFGMDAKESNRFVSRLFGARELALAVATVVAPPPALKVVALTGAAIDAADVVAGLDERRRGNLGTRATLLGPVGALSFVVAGLLLARSADSSR